MAPTQLSEQINLLRAEINASNTANHRLLRNNSPVFIGTVLSWIEDDLVIKESCDRALNAAQEYADHIRDSGPFHSPEDPESHRLKLAALEAADTLERLLGDARPSNRAVALGLAWDRPLFKKRDGG